MRFVTIIFAICALVALASDPCASFSTYTSLADPTARAGVFNCLRSILPYDHLDAMDLADTLGLAAQTYAFVPDLLSPAHPAFAAQGDADLTHDLEAAVATLRDHYYPSGFDMYVAARQAWALCRDGHTRLSPPPCLDYIVPLIPVELCGAPNGANGVSVTICPVQSALATSALAAMNVDLTPHLGATIDTINGRQAWTYVRRWADHRYLTGRDPAQRVEAFLNGGSLRPSWHALLTEKRAVADWRNPEEDTATWNWVLKMKSGDIFTVPFVGYMSPAISGVDGTQYNTPMEADKIAEVACPATTSFAATNASAAPVPTPAQRLAALVAPAPAPAAATAAPAATAAAADPVRQAAVARAAAASAAWHADRRDDFEAVVEDLRALTALDHATYVQLANYEDINTCVFSVTTFAPDDDDLWISELEAAVKAAAAARCGMKNGPKLLIDVRSNPGGSVPLLNLFFETGWAWYTPHHQYVSTIRRGGVIDDMMREYGDEEAVREPGTFAPSVACAFKSAANCPRWWRFGNARMRRHGTQEYAFSHTIGSADQFWAKPTAYPTLRAWCEDADCGAVLGADWAFDVLAEDYRQHGWAPVPQYTTWVFGPVTASCAGQVATRAITYKLGATTSTGGDPALPSNGRLMGGRVPGGNVSPLPDAYTFPRAGTAVRFTIRARFAYTRDTAEISPYTNGETILEFLPLPPAFTTNIWQHASVRDTEAGHRALAAALAAPGQPLAVCPAGHRSWESADVCPRANGVRVAGKLCGATGVYDGPCGPAVCEFGWELYRGECVPRVENVVSVPEFKVFADFD